LENRQLQISKISEDLRDAEEDVKAIKREMDALQQKVSSRMQTISEHKHMLASLEAQQEAELKKLLSEAKRS
jgi:chromosome segregation ATPase